MATIVPVALNELVVALRQLSSRLPEVLQQLKEALGTDFPSTVAGDAERFQECVVRFGINYFTSQMPDSLRQPDKEEFKSQMAQKRPEEVLRAASDDVIDDVLTHLGLGGDKNGRAAQETTILDELYLNGAKDAFSALDHRLLQAICGDLRLEKKGDSVRLVDGLLCHIFQLAPALETVPSSGWAESAGGKKKTNKPRDTDAKKNKKQEKEEEKKGKKRKDKEPEAEEEADEQEDEEQAQEAPVVPRGGPRPSIDEIKPGAGWTYVRMFDTYNATDLLDYCRKHGLKTTGKKKDLIHRILHFLDTGEKELKKGSKKTKSIAAQKSAEGESGGDAQAASPTAMETEKTT